MESQPFDLEAVLKLTTLADRSPADAIDFVGTIVDAAADAKREDVLRQLASLANTIVRRSASEANRTQHDYYLANLWSHLKRMACPHPGGGWEWEQNELEQEIISSRRAVRSPGFKDVPETRKYQILTNLANCYDTTGRFVEAIDLWDDVLAMEPRFGMARGNRAIGLLSYGRALYDQGHAFVMAREAWRELEPSALLGLEPGVGLYFANKRAEIQATIPAGVLNKVVDFDGFSLGAMEAEVKYRRWCLAHRLFLNPLNDIGPFPIAAQDVLTSPSIVAPIREGPRFHGFFNQIKQEFCSARWFAYEAMLASEPHFADTHVLLYNTLDYPRYSIAAEKLKLAYRALYSLFDKIAFFLNAYLGLGISDCNVSFRGIWYTGQQKKRGIRPEFKDRENWPMRGLYWLGKDLYEKGQDFRSVIDPDAQRLSEIRNHLEHKYLKLHLELWAGPAASGSSGFLIDDLAESVSYADFEAMTMRLLSLVRAAIIYLSLGVHREERMRAASRPVGTITPPMVLDIWEDEWKQ
jgi:tetratricopeptide (TPR) repeat protein